MTHEKLKVGAVICDIDGTVAINDGHRGHFEWDKVGADVYNRLDHLWKRTWRFR